MPSAVDAGVYISEKRNLYLEIIVTNNLEDDVQAVLLAINALPRNMSKRDYLQKLFNSVFPKIHEEIVKNIKTKREIVDNLQNTPMKMSYSTFLSKYDVALKATKQKKRNNPKAFAKASRVIA